MTRLKDTVPAFGKPEPADNTNLKNYPVLFSTVLFLSLKTILAEG